MLVSEDKRMCDMDLAERLGFTPACLKGEERGGGDRHSSFPCVFHFKSCSVGLVDFLRCLERASAMDTPTEHVERLQDLDRDVAESLRMRGSSQPCTRAFEEVRARLMQELLDAEPVAKGRS